MTSELTDWLCVNSGYKREFLWMAQRFYRQINVEVRPVQMVGGWPFDVRNSANARVLKPGEFGKRDKKLFLSEQDPKAMRRYVGDLSRRSACSTRRGFHARVP